MLSKTDHNLYFEGFRSSLNKRLSSTLIKTLVLSQDWAVNAYDQVHINGILLKVYFSEVALHDLRLTLDTH